MSFFFLLSNNFHHNISHIYLYLFRIVVHNPFNIPPLQFLLTPLTIYTPLQISMGKFISFCITPRCSNFIVLLWWHDIWRHSEVNKPTQRRQKQDSSLCGDCRQSSRNIQLAVRSYTGGSTVVMWWHVSRKTTEKKRAAKIFYLAF